LQRKREQANIVMRNLLRNITDSENEMIGSNRVSTKEICAQWPKFTESEAGGLKTPESLSVQVAKSYNLPQAQADADVKAWLAGRTF
jgi:hypothetical protein